MPVGSCVFFYSQIVMAVVKHEKALKEQAKKMNVESLRQGDHVSKVYYEILFKITIWSCFPQAEQSAELKIAKVAVTNVFLWIAIWSPYATVVIIGPFGDRDLITPLGAQIPSCAAKLASIFNPIMFALSHPKYAKNSHCILLHLFSHITFFQCSRYREALGEKFPCLVVQQNMASAAKG